MNTLSALDPWIPRALALLRIVVGYLYLQHGTAKLLGFPHVAMFDNLSIASLIGFITLFGIATRNGIMLVSHIHYLRDVEGVSDARQAVLQGAAERLAPILMTALAAGLALIPIALGMGKPGSEIQAPMALVILCGLLSSTALNMVVVPVAYFKFGKK